MRWTLSIPCANLQNGEAISTWRLFLECAHAAAIGLRGAAKQDHWPAILLGIGEAGETVHHAWAGHDDAGAGATGQIAVGLRRVGGGLLVAHADKGNALLLR